MRTISDALKNKINGDKGMQLVHKILLYRRHWTGSAFELETNAIDITHLMNYKGTNVTINQQLDVDSANTWKVGNLVLTLYNEKNCFWEGKEDGLFPSPYSLYGSKVEYYVGDVTLNDYVKQFTGYLTSLPTYRQDDALIDLQVLNRLDFLETVSAEKVSTTVTNEQATEQDTTHVITANAAVGRITKVLKGASVETAIELTEKTDYSIDQLNDYNLGAILTLESALLADENIYISYIYWRKGIMIDELVIELLDAAGVDAAHRIVEPVVFTNAVRIAKTTFDDITWAWVYALSADSFTHSISGGGDGENTYTNYSYNPAHNTYPSEKIISCKCLQGRFKFTVDQMYNVASDPYAGGICALTSGASTVITGFTFGGAGDSSVRDDVYVLINGGTVKVADGVVGSTFEIEYHADGTVNAYKDGTLIYTGITTANLNIDEVRVLSRYSTCLFYVSNISARPLEDTEYKTYPFIKLNNYNSSSIFLGFDRLNATVSTSGTPDVNFQVRYKNNGGEWTEFVEYTLATALNKNYNTVEIVIKNIAAYGNTISFTNTKLWNFIKQDIPLGVCDLADMSVLEALVELASMSMYEIGFDADDKFFFRNRNQVGDTIILTDDKIIEMPSAKYNLDRLKTRVSVAYGNYNKIVDSETQNEAHPNNLDRYGTRPHEINGGQLLPVDNVDLAYAIAPTVYAELSILRLNISIDIVFNLEIELGDFVQIYHSNNLFVQKDFSDFTKWKELGIYGRRCKVESIKSNFNKRTTTLTLTDYTESSDIPVAEGQEFIYNFMKEFNIKK